MISMFSESITYYITISIFLAILLDVWLVRSSQKRGGLSSLLVGIIQFSRGILSYLYQSRLTKAVTRFFPLISLLFGIGLIIISYQTTVRMKSHWLYIVLLTGGIFLTGISLYKDNLDHRITQINGYILKHQLIKLQVWQIAGMITAIFLSVLTIQFSGFTLKMEQPYLAIGAWVLGIGIFVTSGYSIISNNKISRKTIFTFLLLICAAFLIRIYHVVNLPIVLSGDEASFGLNVVEFLQGKRDNIFSAGWFSFPTMYSYIQSISVLYLGNTILALRVTSVIVGALTVGAVYIFTREMYGNAAGLFAAIFMAGFHFHNNFSRIGLNNIWDGFWYLIVLGCVFYGWRKESRNAFILAGISLGLAQYFYVSSRLLFVIIPVFIGAVSLQDPKKFKHLMPDIIIMVVGMLVVFLPLCWYFINNPNEYLAPLQRTSIFGKWMVQQMQFTGHSPLEIIQQQIWDSFRGYTHIPLRHWYRPGTPMLRPLPAVIFFVGLGFMIRHWKDSRSILLGLWLVTFGFSNALSESTPAAQRYVAVSPALAIIIAYGLVEAKEILTHQLPRFRKLIAALVVIIILGISADEIRFYMLEYAPHSDFGGDPGMIAQRLANYLQDKTGDYEVLFFGAPKMSYHSISSLPFLASHIKMTDITETWTSHDRVDTSANNLIFVFLPNHPDDLLQVEKNYPCGKLISETIRDGDILYWLYEVSPNLCDS